MTDPAFALPTQFTTPEKPSPDVRRFQPADLMHHRWLVERLQAAYPHLNNTQLIGWVKGLVFSNETMFLFQDTGVALAQIVRSYTIAPEPVLEERFVFVANRNDAEQVAAAAAFYSEFARWAKTLGIKQIMLADKLMSDVPPELIGKKLGKLQAREQWYAQVR